MNHKLRVDWRFLFIAPLFLCGLETAYIKFNGISIFSLHVLTAYLIFIALGLIFGLMVFFSKGILRLILCSSLLVAFILSQIDPMSQLPVYVKPRYLFLYFIPLLYLIRAKIDKLFLIIFGVFFLGSFFTSKMQLLNTINYSLEEKSSRLIPFIEIVLDEHLGLEGFSSLDMDTSFASNLSEIYVKKGFRVYSKAYSRDMQTLSSFASFLNYEPIEDYYGTYFEFLNGLHILKQNKHFETLSKKGYVINVFQNNWIDLCKPQKNINLKKCSTFNYTHFLPYSNDQIIQQSVNIVENSFSFFSRFSNWETFKNKFKQSIGIPTNGNEISSFPAKATYDVLPDLLTQLHSLKKGNMYFIHLLVPHGPHYLLDDQCHYNHKKTSRINQYKMQTLCAHYMINKILKVVEKSKEGKNSIIIIHGDHGSKLLLPDPDHPKTMSSRNIMRAYNTLFLVKSPMMNPGHDKKPLPLDYLLHAIATNKKDLDYEPDKQFVFLRLEHTKSYDLGKIEANKLFGKNEINLAKNS